MTDDHFRELPDLVQKFITCHLQVKPSLISHRGNRGPFTVKTADGLTFAVCKTRKEALAAVDQLIKEGLVP